jgi:hypothetical protein
MAVCHYQWGVAKMPLTITFFFLLFSFFFLKKKLKDASESDVFSTSVSEQHKFTRNSKLKKN